MLDFVNSFTLHTTTFRYCNEKEKTFRTILNILVAYLHYQFSGLVLMTRCKRHLEFIQTILEYMVIIISVFDQISILGNVHLHV